MWKWQWNYRWKFCTSYKSGTNLNGNSESSRGSESDESKEQRRYIYDRLAHHNNILTPNPFVCDSAINGDIIQNFSQNSVLKEIYIIN